MSDRFVDVHTQLAASEHARVERGQDGVLHVRVGAVTLHLDLTQAEDLSTTLARAMLALRRAERTALAKRAPLALVRGDVE